MSDGLTLHVTGKDTAALLRRLNGGKPKPGDVEQLRAMIRRDDAGAVRDTVAIQRLALESLVDYIAPSVAAKEIMDCNLKRERAALGYEQAGALERLLIESVILAHLRYTDLERRYTAVLSQSITLAGGDLGASVERGPVARIPAAARSFGPRSQNGHPTGANEHRRGRRATNQRGEHRGDKHNMSDEQQRAERDRLIDLANRFELVAIGAPKRRLMTSWPGGRPKRPRLRPCVTWPGALAWARSALT